MTVAGGRSVAVQARPHGVPPQPPRTPPCRPLRQSFRARLRHNARRSARSFHARLRHNAQTPPLRHSRVGGNPALFRFPFPVSLPGGEGCLWAFAPRHPLAAPASPCRPLCPHPLAALASRSFAAPRLPRRIARLDKKSVRGHSTDLIYHTSHNRTRLIRYPSGGEPR